MAGEAKQLLGDKRSAVLQMTSDFVFSLTDEITDHLIKVLRAYFHQHTLTTLYRWSPTLKFSEVHISAEFKDEERYLPQIVMTILPYERAIALGNKGETFDQDGEHYITYTGAFDFDITFRIVASHASTRDQLMDLLLIGLVYPLQQALVRRNIVLIQNTARGVAKTTGQLTSNKKTFEGAVAVRTTVEWTQHFKSDSYTFEDYVLESTVI